MLFLDLEQNTPEWHAFRKGKIGASMAPIIMGDSPWTTQYMLWERMIGIREDVKQTDAMKRGLDLEPHVRKLFMEEMDIDDMKPVVAQHDIYPWMIASIDGYSPSRNMAIEIKCASKSDHESAKRNKCPDKYYAQLQHQMCVLSSKNLYNQVNFIVYVSYHDGEMIHRTIPYDHAYAINMFNAESEFYNKVITCTPPELTSKDVVERDDYYIKAASDKYRYLYHMHKDISLHLESAKNDLINLCDGKSTRCNDIVVKKIIKKGHVKYDDISELKDIDLNLYRNPPTEYWKISLSNDEPM